MPCPTERGCPSLPCRWWSPRSTSGSSGRSSCLRPRTATRAISPRRPAGSSAPRTSASCRAAAFAGNRGSLRRPTSSASATARSTCWPEAGSWSPRRRRWPRACRRLRPGPRRCGFEVGDEPGIDSLAEHLALAGYERVDRVEERGQFALRGGIVDVYPTTGREPLRIELFGDEIEGIRAFSAFTQRTLHPVQQATIRPAAERRLDLTETTLRDDGRGADGPRRPRPRHPGGPGSRLAPRRGAPGLGGGVPGRDATLARPRRRARSRFPRDSRTPSRRSGRPSPPAGLSEAENELRGFMHAGHRVVVAFPHRGEALRTQNLIRRVEPGLMEAGDEPPARGRAGLRRRPGPQRLRLARAWSRPAPGQPGLPQATAEGRRAARESAPVLRRPAHGRPRRPRGPRHRPAARLRDEGGGRGHARLPPARLPRRRPGVRPARADREGLALRRRRRERAGAVQARGQGVAAAQDARAGERARAGRRADPAVRAETAGPGSRLRPRARVHRAPGGVLPLPGDGRPGHGHRGGQGGPRDGAPDGPARLRRRRLRQDGGGRPGRLRRGGERQADADARPHHDPRPAALEHLPRALPRLPGQRRDGLPLPQACGGQADPGRLRRREGRCPDRHPSRALARRDPERARARDRRRGAAFRGRPEGAPASAAARGRRARAQRDADPAHPAHVALGPAGHLRDRDAARGPAPDPHARRRLRRGAGQAGARPGMESARTVLLPAQPRRDDRGGGREAAADVPGPALHRRARADARARAGGADARRSSPATRTCSSPRRSSSRGSTSRRRTR